MKKRFGLIKSTRGSGAFGAILGVLLVIAVAYFAYTQFFAVKQISVAGLPGPSLSKGTGSSQRDVTGYEVTFNYKKGFKTDALVVGAKKYNEAGIKNGIAPVDVILAWGSIAENNGETDFAWAITDRAYSYSSTTSFKETEIIRHSSLNHLIGQSDSVTSQIKKLRIGDHVKITGYLVDVSAEPQMGDIVKWNTSTKFTDKGLNSSEIVYVTSLEVIKETAAQ